mmetsp:Transcript_14549/g.24070  ORF Transcript_14549/g.24070 Transcript_14549/m.24070 type:complete len:168 (+) Transcript_14549:151-654(+)|eukprot:CAMPEP_0184338208 /NCGR_PEP_ID=MMETSP1089-20130417/6729_1 /TAXON_ID=38269 ORGANISM="Gloeochaete wittrockiana, Strain SAG46.84" /NCGR_SAMPLE_ID=MMETSP1089 /ASSEMBLY_ACC=CAM_ASM_000445 /LENGTH=167 /DNA_ID=CAMNT_0026664565 /DNA_START=146 /DNA_END=649 /DNA_ORIENTATION=+
MGGTVFVTVGTTLFDELIRILDSKQAHTLLFRKGYTRLLMQIGKGSHEPGLSQVPGFQVEFYRYKPTLAEDYRNASLIISHAGAGSIMESLELRKPLVVVVNELLMNNHQTEIASELAECGHLVHAVCSNLLDVLAGADFSKRVLLLPPDTKRFARIVDEVMGIKVS